MQRLIKTEEDYNVALERLDEIFHADPGSPEADELELLVVLVEKYEHDLVGEFPNPDPIEAIKFKMEQNNLTQLDLANLLGHKSRASEILSRKRSMSLKIIRKISAAWQIPLGILAQEYELGWGAYIPKKETYSLKCCSNWSL